MILNRREFRIPLNDIQINKGIGIGLPYDPTYVFKTTYSTKEQVKSNLINYLLTNPGERVMNVSFGAGLRKYLFEQMNSIDELVDLITTKITTYIPQIASLNIEIFKDDINNAFTLVISYSINNQSDNIVLKIV